VTERRNSDANRSSAPEGRIESSTTTLRRSGCEHTTPTYVSPTQPGRIGMTLQTASQAQRQRTGSHRRSTRKSS